ncbi:MAG: 7TM-DISM domain-containing protein, partial [Anaerolineales bacterium]
MIMRKYLSSSPRLLLTFLPLLIALIMPASSFAQSGTEPENPVVLSDAQDRYRLGTHLEILKDDSAELTIEDVTSSAYQDRFTPSPSANPNFGFQTAAYWVRLKIINRAEQNDQWVLENDFINMHYIDVYLPASNGQGYELRQAGALRPFDVRDIPFRRHAFSLEIPPGGDQTIYMRFQSQSSMTLSLNLWSRAAYTRFMLLDQLQLGLIYGAMLIMAIYNIPLFVMTGERAYAYLVLFILSERTSSFLYRGLAAQYLDVNSPRIITIGILVFLGLQLFFILRFAAALLRTAERAPRLHRASYLPGGVLLLTIVAAPFGDYQLLGQIQLFTGALIFIAIFVYALMQAFRGSRAARFLLFSSIPFLLSGIAFIITRLGLVPSTLFGEEFTNYGMVWMVGVWSFALADQLNWLKAEAQRTSLQLSESESRLAQLIDALPIGVAVFGTDLKPRLINKETQKLLSNPSEGVQPDMNMERDLEETKDYFSFQVAGTDRPYPLDELPMIKAIQDKQRATADDIELHVGSRRIVLESWAMPLLDMNAEVTGSIVAFLDISDRLEKEELLRESEERFRATFEQAAVGIAHVAPDGRFLRVNNKMCQIVGYSNNDFIGLTFQEITHPEDLQADIEAAEKLLSGEIEIYSTEKRYLHKSGYTVWVSLTASLLRHPSGEPNYFISVIDDITLRKLVEGQVQFQASLLE